MSVARWFRNLFVAAPRTSKLPRKAHPLNAPGPVYVEYRCCITCGIPTDIAPGIFDWDESDGLHCFVKRQPSTDEEFDQILEVLKSQEVDCVRIRDCPASWRVKALAIDGGECVDDEHPLNSQAQ